MRTDTRGARVGAALAILAAFTWSTYYVFVLWLAPRAGPAAVLAYPFLIGGAAFTVLALLRGEGHVVVALWKQPAGYARIGLAGVMQVATLAATYSAGPIDSSLLALLGDVVMVPVFLMLFFGEDRPLLRSHWFLGGILVCLVGDGLTIVAGHAVNAVSGWAWLIVPAIPISIGLYFLLIAVAARTTSLVALNAHAMLGGGLLMLVVSPFLPGGAGSLVVVEPGAIVLLVVTSLTTFFLAPYLYFVAIRRGGLVPTAIWMSMIPAFTLLLTVVVLGLAPVLLGALGVPIAIAGAFLALEGQRKVGAVESTGPSG